MDEKQFERLEAKLDTISRLLAMTILQGKSVTEQVSVLSAAGFRPIEISRITGKSENHVSVTLSKLKKLRMKQEGNEKSREENGGNGSNVG